MIENLELIPCPKCGNDFPKKRKELGYHVCVNCSTVDRVVGITTVEGTGDHTYNDLIIMDRKKAFEIAKREAEIKGSKTPVFLETQDYEKDEEAISQSIDEAVSQSLSDEVVEEYDSFDPNKEPEGIEGIDY